MKVNTYLIVTRYMSLRTYVRRPYVTLGCEGGGTNKPRTKPRVDDEEEEVQVKRRGPYGTKKNGCPFKLEGEQMAMHNHAIGSYNHGHVQAAKLSEEQLIQTEQFRKSHVPPRNLTNFPRTKCGLCRQVPYSTVGSHRDDSDW
ncbi:hypothetical protein M9H77_14127 [Catharanthus roseus]|uniref:Uncharacterized protein n=1 Tax=Catharanthus roseus TaxID=4058 RepID=A0ACC0BMB2_CATRO|nr:hypothetical protein M9H77_14127 [Catharanthus roseus]